MSTHLDASAKQRGLSRVEYRNVARELENHKRHVGAANEKTLPYAELFPCLRGRAFSEKHGLSVEALPNGTLVAAKIGNQTGLAKHFVQTGNRALAEADRWALIQSAVMDGRRSTLIPPPNDPPKEYRRGSWESEQWSQVVELTEYAVLGDALAKTRLNELFSSPVLAVLLGRGPSANVSCVVTANHELPLTVRFPDYGSSSVEFGWRLLVLWLRALAGIRDDYAKNYEVAARDATEANRKSDGGEEDTGMGFAHAPLRRFAPVPPVTDPEALAVIEEVARKSFITTIQFELV